MLMVSGILLTRLGRDMFDIVAVTYSAEVVLHFVDQLPVMPYFSMNFPDFQFPAGVSWHNSPPVTRVTMASAGKVPIWRSLFVILVLGHYAES